jgi:hypothetical protein
MATVSFTPEILAHVSCPSRAVFGHTVKEVLDAYFESNRPARGYILDERGCLRPRLAVFVDGVIAEDRNSLGDPVHLHANVFVFALPRCQERD